ncbi:MAG: serine hydrolase domain-containing protein, partial [Acidobacteriota bacterium]|nr:serine hydrolase domain-containing protein [Acidobacteriota bacterium]
MKRDDRLEDKVMGRWWGLPLALLLFIVGINSSAQTLSDAGVMELDTYLESALTDHDVPGLVALVTNGQNVIYEASFGVADVAGDRVMEADAIFRIASMTKPITSLGVMMLIDDGVFGLDDRVSDYLTGLAGREVFTRFDFDDGTYESVAAEVDITVRHLLSHTSGLAYGFNSHELAKLSAGDRIADATGYPLLHEPGERWTYGISTRVLGHLIEERTGRGLFDFFSERILGPLGMIDTSFSGSVSDRQRVVTRHQRSGGTLTEVPNAGPWAAPENGDGGLYSTARDYARFMRLFLNAGRTDQGVQLVEP